MNLTALALLGLATSVGQTPPSTPPTPANDATITSKKTFPMPVDVKPGRRGEIHSLQLWYSRDRGQLWEIMDQKKADAESLTFRDKDGDGVYWVNMVTRYADGRLDPPDVSQVVPAQKFIIDTTPPVVKVTAATRAGEDVAVDWTVEDKNPNDATTAVYIRSAATPDAQWQQAPQDAIQKRTARFKTTIPGPVVVMVVTADLAKNSGSASKEIAATGGTRAEYPPSSPASTAPTPPAGSPAAPALLNREGPLPPPGLAGGPAEAFPVAPGAVTPLPSGPAPSVGAVPPAAIPSGPAQPSSPPQPQSAYQPQPLPTQPGALDTGFPPSPPTAAPAPVQSMFPTGPEPLRTLGPGSDVLPAPGTGNFRPTAATTPPVEVPPMQVIRSPRFDLGYQVDGGVSGVSKIVLYVTRDDGRSWRAWSTHDGKESPLKVVLDDPRLNRDLEGDYGFKLVPVSGAGLSDAVPGPGTPPEMKVHVDTTAPLVEIYAPQADPDTRNSLLLIWKATDRNFGRDPILIEYAEATNGPWKPVAAGDGQGGSGRLANTGKYSWAIPAGLITPQVYLRVTAYDLGGNKTERITERPILVDLTRPKAKISGIVAPTGR